MNIEVWITFVGTVLILMSTPGPSQLLMLSNSLGNGYRRSLATAIGDLSANFLQMVVASVGLVSLIHNSREFFLTIKWAGVAYLVYLGLRLIFSGNGNHFIVTGNQRSISSLYWQGFFTSAANPKAVVFFAALFPQFIDSSEPLMKQFVVLSFSYLTIDGIFLCCYGKFAEWITHRRGTSGRTYFSQVSGSFLIAAAILLGLKDVEAN